MKKRLAFVITLLTALVLITGCGSQSGSGGDEQQKEAEYELSTDIADDGKSVSISVKDNSGEGSTMSGGLIVGENEKLVCVPELSEGSVTIELLRESELGLDENSSGEELESASNTAASYTMKAEGTKTAELTAAAGDYYVRVTADKGTTGQVSLKVEAAQ